MRPRPTDDGKMLEDSPKVKLALLLEMFQITGRIFIIIKL